MPRPHSPLKFRRQHHLGIRLSPDQRSRLRRRARRAGLSVSAYVMHLIEGKRLARTAGPPLDLVPLPLLAQWQRTGNNLNQISRALNRGRNASAEWICDSMAELLRLMIDDQITRRFADRFGARRIALRLV